MKLSLSLEKYDSPYFKNVLNCTWLVGNINNDGILNILDVFTLVVCVLENNCDGCFDVDGDAEINILVVIDISQSYITRLNPPLQLFLTNPVCIYLVT